MSNLSAVLWIETRKVLRSKVPLVTALGFLIAPLACAFLMFIYKNPDFARSMGLVSAKANLMGGSADWSFFLNMLAQAISVGGILLFNLVISWVFGREFADNVVKDLLAVPVARSTILLAKFIVAAIWSLSLALMVYLVGVTLGGWVGLNLWSQSAFVGGSLTVAVATLLVVAVSTPFALVASVGRGYLLPVGISMLTMAVAQIIGLIGYGDYFPWTIPGLYANVAGPGNGITSVSYWVVLFTCLAGMAATYWWWMRADQNR